MSIRQTAVTAAATVAAMFVAMPLDASAPPGPTVIYVDDDNCPGPGDGSEGNPYCSIQTAIDNAMDGYEIVVAPGTYFETISLPGRAVWLHSSDGPEATLIDAQGRGSVVKAWAGEAADMVEGFTITGGTGEPFFKETIVGGGVFVLVSSPTVVSCVFAGNTAGLGGGLANLGGDPTVTSCTFEGNGAALGGGMYTSGNPAVTTCMFSGNTADFGGGMYNESATVRDCTFESNTALQVGGGMYNSGGSPTVTDCVFEGNAADLHGGGMYNEQSSPTVTSSTFSGNSSGPGSYGGGIFNFGSNLTVTSCTFSGNSAGFEGGGVSNFTSSSMLMNCTFIGNIASNGGGMSNSEDCSVTASNCTFAANTANTGNAISFNFFGPPGVPSDFMMVNSVLWDGGKEIWINDGSTLSIVYSTVQGGWPGTGNIDADPLFVDPDNGDYRLSPGSPCIDAANNTAIPFRSPDLDGNPRLVDDPATKDTGFPVGWPGPIVDMGAYEYQGRP